MSVAKTTSGITGRLSQSSMSESGYSSVEDDILSFFNDVTDPRDISEVLCDTPGNSRSRLASQIVKTRDQLSAARFKTVHDIFSIPGFNNELRISLGETFSQQQKPIALRTRRGARIGGTWVYEISGLALDIVENEADDNILIRLPTGRYAQQIISTCYNPVEDGFSISAIPKKLANLIESPTPYSSLLIKSPLIHLDRVSANVLEMSCDGKAFPFIRESAKALSLSSEEQALYRLAYGDNELEDSHYENIPLSDSDRPDENLPQWWNHNDTQRFLRSLQVLTVKAIDRRFAPDEEIPSNVLQRIIKKSALELLTTILARKKVDKLRNTLIGSGRTPEQSTRLAQRIGHRLEKDFLYKHSHLLRRFTALTDLSGIRKMLRSPRKDVKADVVRFIVEAMGTRVLAFPSLVDDIFSVGEDMLDWWKAQETWHGARAVWTQAREVEILLERLHRAISSELRASTAELYTNKKKHFQHLRELQMQLMEGLVAEKGN
jgi:hypothetical protein